MPSLKSLNIQSLTQDVTNPSIVHVTMQSSLPLDTIIVNIGNVMDHNGASGFPVLNKDIVLFNTSKTIQVTTAGTLSTLLSATELATVTNLTLTGTIDARDFVTLRDLMPALKELDISTATIVAYTGAGGTAPDNAASASRRIRRQVRQTISEMIELKDVNTGQYIKSADVTYPANEIPEDAFYSYVTDGKESLKSIVMPLTLRSIGSEAFSYTGLTSIAIPETVTSIGDWAFSGTSIKTVLLPASLISLGSGCFFDIITLESINVATANTAFLSEQGVLYSKDKSKLYTYPTLKNQSAYTVPEGVKLIDHDAFYNNQYLITVHLPSTLTDISDYAFYGCDNLNIINFPSSLKSIGVAAFFSTNLTDVNLSACNQLTTITKYAFQDCSVANLSLPASITTIEQYAFSGYNNLAQIDWSGNTALTTLGDCVLINSENLNSVKLPRSLSSVGSNMFSLCGKLTDIIVDAANPFFSSMDGVLFNKNYTSLIAYAPGKTAEKYVVPTTVTEISNTAFYACLKIKSVDAQNSHLVSIGLSAFDSTPLTEIILPASVTTIGKYGFYNCSALSTFKIYSVVPPALGAKVFQGASTATCQLYVPKDSKAAYALADQWNSFSNIEEFIIDGNEDLWISDLIISQQNGVLRISGVTEGETLNVYSLSGKLIASRKAETSTITIPLPEKGVYILQVGTKHIKVILK